MMKSDADYNFSRRIEAIHSHWKWILGGTLLCSLVALLISLILPNIYRVTTYVLVSEPKMEVSSQPTLWQYASIRTYIPFVDNDAAIDRALRDLRLDRAPYELTVETFRRHQYLDVDVPKGTQLLEIDVEFPNAQIATNLANYFAQHAVNFNANLTLGLTRNTEAFLKERLDQSSKHLAAAEANLLQVKETAQVEDKDQQINILFSEKAEISKELEKLRLDGAQKEAQVKSLREELSKEPRVFSLRKSVLSDNFLQRAVQELHGDNDGTLAVTEDSVNAVHEELQKQYANSLAMARANEAGSETAKADLASFNAEIRQLLAVNTAKKGEIERAEREFKLAKDDFERAAQSYNNASVAVASRSPDLKQLNPATVPERPVRPKIWLNTVLTGLLSCVLLSLTAVTWSGFLALKSNAPSGQMSSEEPFTHQN